MAGLTSISSLQEKFVLLFFFYFKAFRMSTMNPQRFMQQ